MFNITVIAMGKLKEKFYISAAQEYAMRLGAYCKFQILELPEHRLPDNPSLAEIQAGLNKEADLIRDERDGKYIYYELNTSVLEEIMLWISDLKGEKSDD